MKALRKLLDNIKPHVEKGGKFHFLHSTFDAAETLFFVPNTVTSTGTHIKDAIDLKRTMFLVVIATIPALLFGMWNIGYQHFLAIGEQSTLMNNFIFGLIRMLPLIIVSYVVGLGLEVLFSQLRGHEVNEGYFVSGMLIPLIIPIDTPLWMVAVAVAFAVIIGKEVFGGTGMNIWNPALLARAFLFFAYPSSMSGEKIWTSGLTEGLNTVDGFTGATPLAQMAANGQESTKLAAELTKVNTSATDIITQVSDKFGYMTDAIGAKMSHLEMFIGTYSGSIGETSTLAILLGAAILLFTGVASWRVMLSVFAGGYFMGFLFNILGSETNVYMQMNPLNHLLLGGFAFGAVFMATDPVSASQTKNGKIIYGFLIGIIAVLIRVVNPAYPEGMMLSILFLNTFAPLIDHYIVQANIKKRLKRVKITA